MFSDHYRHIRVCAARVAAESGDSIPESVVQELWYSQLFDDGPLHLDTGARLDVLAPGWWNRSEGPDFREAQLVINGALVTGDVEVHFNHGGWTQHGHHLDHRYDRVALHVTMDTTPPREPPRTAAGRPVATLLLGRYLPDGVPGATDDPVAANPRNELPVPTGACSTVADSNASLVHSIIALAGEWRMLNKTRALQERVRTTGSDQALYELLLSALGYSHFKNHFRLLARELPYDRARQLASHDPLLLEAALLHLAGLLPEKLPAESPEIPHFTRLHAMRSQKLPGLKALPLLWRRAGVRPTNGPERRLAGAARLVGCTADKGLNQTLQEIWTHDMAPQSRRRAFETIFPSATGFWSVHCSWTGKALEKPVKLIGPGRIRSIIGNVFIPAGLAHARRECDRTVEDRIREFFQALPKEDGNRVLSVMTRRIFGSVPPKRISFQVQQGLLQVFEDWCRMNPSCRRCGLLAHLEAMQKDVGYAPTSPTSVP